MGQTFINYAAAWVRFYNANSATMDKHHSSLYNCELWMLWHNGVGVFDTVDSGFPSWMPNFPRGSKKGPNLLLHLQNCYADRNVFLLEHRELKPRRGFYSSLGLSSMLCKMLRPFLATTKWKRLGKSHFPDGTPGICAPGISGC